MESGNLEKLESKGGWLEKYVYTMFRVAGFDVSRNEKLAGSGGVKHEIDVILRNLGEDEKSYFIECKDTKLEKSYIDTHIGKMIDLISNKGEDSVHGGAFIIARHDESEKDAFENYRKYSAKHNILFVDGRELESCWDKLVESGDIEKFREELIDFFSLEEPIEVKKGGKCFIATASLGSPLHPKLDILREFRDQELNKSPFGKKFVEFYYKLSPPIAKLISKSEKLRKISRKIFVEPLVEAQEEPD